MQKSLFFRVFEMQKWQFVQLGIGVVAFPHHFLEPEAKMAELVTVGDGHESALFHRMLMGIEKTNLKILKNQHLWKIGTVCVGKLFEKVRVFYSMSSKYGKWFFLFETFRRRIELFCFRWPKLLLIKSIGLHSYWFSSSSKNLFFGNSVRVIKQL